MARNLLWIVRHTRTEQQLVHTKVCAISTKVPNAPWTLVGSGGLGLVIEVEGGARNLVHGILVIKCNTNVK